VRVECFGMYREIRIYNTLTKEIEIFEPTTPGFVKIYVCGITPYDYTHLGHARTFVFFDALKRFLSMLGYSVLHVMNITDIDDKILLKASKTGIDWREVVDTYTKDYMDALNKLNIKIDLHPRVTDHIVEIIEFIKTLIDKGYAYVAPSGSVYFDVDKYGDYGKLSGNIDRKTWSQETEYVYEKKNPYDFALWKARKPGEPYWDSPWGPGRPGWHIECSVMSTKYLGERIDIHGGGTDLIFPHHENERAQSEAALGTKPWVKYWVHIGMLTFENQKMSKSLGNIISLKEAFKKWNPAVIRLWYLTSHYRKPQDFSEESIDAVNRFYDRLVYATLTIKKLLKEAISLHKSDDRDLEIYNYILSIRRGFYEALSNDFNTPKAIAEVNELITLINRELVTNPKYLLVTATYRLLNEMNQILGVLDEYLYGAGSSDELVDKLVKIIIDIRKELRERKMYELSDKIRAELEREGFVIMDKGLETTWVRRK